MSEGESPKKKQKTTHNEKEEREEEWKDVFRLFDRDGNGHVSATELGILLRGLGLNPTEKDISEMINKIDKNNTGQIEWEEFADFMHHMKKTTDQDHMEEMIRAFKLFDYNDDDHIDANELKRVMTSMGDKLSLDEANQMVDVADIDQDGRINYLEFIKFMFPVHQ